MQKLTAERCHKLRKEMNDIYHDYAHLLSMTCYSDELKGNQWKQFEVVFDHIGEILESYSRVLTGDLLRSIKSLAKFYAPVFHSAANQSSANSDSTESNNKERILQCRTNALYFFSQFDQYIDLSYKQ